MAQWRNTQTQWGVIARVLHGVIALLIITLFVVGLAMGEIGNIQDKIFVYAMHKSFGLLVLALILVRILWRLTNKAPADLPDIPKPMQLAAHAGHFGLYALMLVVPLTGWLAHSLTGFTSHWFGQENLPVLPTIVAKAESREVMHQAGELHELAAWAIAALVAVHVGAALFHHFIRKDGTLLRMFGRLKG